MMLLRNGYRRRRCDQWLIAPLLFVLLGVAATVRGALVIPVVWNGANADWMTPGGWTPPLVDPDSLFLFYPDNSASSHFFVVTIPFGTVTVSSSHSVSELFVSSDGTVRITNGSLDVEGFTGFDGVITNEGEVRITGNGLLEATSILGGGVLELSNDDAKVSGLIANGSGHTIRGYGQVGSYFALDAMNNSGTILADVAGRTLRVQGIGLENDGLMRATAGGRLKIEQLIFTNDNLLDSDGGNITIDTPSFNNDGTVRARNGGVIFIEQGTVNNSSHLFDIQANSAMYLEGVVVKRGTIQTAASGLVEMYKGTNRFEGPMTLEGNFFVTGGSHTWKDGLFDTRLATTAVYTNPTASMDNATFWGGTFTGGGTVRVSTPSALDGTAPINLVDFNVYLPGSSRLTLRGDLNMHDGSALIIEDHTVGFGTYEALLDIDGPVNIAGNGGTIRFGQVGHEFNNNIIQPVNNGYLTLGSNITVSGPTGSVGVITTNLTNHGTITADGGVIRLNNLSIVNDGTLSATNGGSIHLRPGLFVNNVGGNITAGAGSTVFSSAGGQDFSPVTIVGGTINGAPTGTFQNSKRTILDSSANTITTHNVRLYAAGDTIMSLKGAFNHNAEFFIWDNVLGFGTGDAVLRMDGPVTLNGTGSVVFSTQTHSNNNNVIDAVNDGSLTIGSGVTVRTDPSGWGTITTPITNHGLISANNGSLFLTNTSVTNDGRMEAINGGMLQLAQFTQLNNIAGTLRSGASSTVDIRTGTAITGGTLDGGGLFDLSGDVFFNSSTHPITVRDSTVQINGTSKLILTGDLTLDNATIRLRDLQIGFGTTPASLRANGAASIAGTGTIHMNTGGTNLDNHLDGVDANSSLTIGSGINVFAGAGHDGWVLLNLTNHGQFLTQGGRFFIFNPSTTNTGTMKAENGGSIQIGQNLQVTHFDNTSAILNAGAGSWVQFSGSSGLQHGQATIKGGQLTGTGEFRIGSGFVFFDGINQPVTLNSTLRITNGTSLTVQGELAMTSALLTLHDGNFALGTPARLRASGNASVTGTGEIHFLAGNGNVNETVIDTPSGGSFTFGPGITMRALTGGTGFFEGRIFNQGTIHADGGRLAFTTAEFFNSGLVKAESGGTIDIGRTNQTSTFDNTGGTIHVAAGSHALLSGGPAGHVTLKGGTLTGAGEFRPGPSTLYDGSGQTVTLSSTQRITSSTLLTVQGQLVMDDGLITIQDGAFQLGTPARLRASGHASITGTGEIQLLPGNGNLNENIIDAPGGGSFTFGPGIKLTAPTGGGGFIEGALTTAGHIHNNGLIFVYEPLTITSTGSLTGSGTFHRGLNGSIVNNGLLSPGNSAGILTVSGDSNFSYLQNNHTSTLHFEIGGTTVGSQYDRLNVAGTNGTLVLLGGTLLVELIDGFIPDPSHVFTIITAGTITGAGFSNVTDGKVVSTSGIHQFDVIRTTNQIQLTNFQFIPEPAGLGLLLLALPALLRRRRCA